MIVTKYTSEAHTYILSKDAPLKKGSASNYIYFHRKTFYIVSFAYDELMSLNSFKKIVDAEINTRSLYFTFAI